MPDKHVLRDPHKIKPQMRLGLLPGGCHPTAGSFQIGHPLRVWNFRPLQNTRPPAQDEGNASQGAKEVEGLAKQLGSNLSTSQKVCEIGSKVLGGTCDDGEVSSNLSECEGIALIPLVAEILLSS